MTFTSSPVRSVHLRSGAPGWRDPGRPGWLDNAAFFPRPADNLKNGRFHQHLRDTFAPIVVRYVDLMESSIAQSIHKGFEKERWEIKG